MTKKNKKITIAIITLLVITAIGVTMAVSHYSKPDFTKMTPQQIRQYFDSNQFRDANEDKRREIREEMGEAMMARAEKQANEYSALSTDEKTVYLDKIIDEMQARRAEFLARESNDVNRPDANGPPDPNRFGFGRRGANMGQRPRVNPERRRERSSRTSADTSVKMIQFRQDLMNRMQERGIQGGGGRGGFGGGFGGPPPGR